MHTHTRRCSRFLFILQFSVLTWILHTDVHYYKQKPLEQIYYAFTWFERGVFSFSGASHTRALSQIFTLSCPFFLIILLYLSKSDASSQSHWANVNASAHISLTLIYLLHTRTYMHKTNLNCLLVTWTEFCCMSPPPLRDCRW